MFYFILGEGYTTSSSMWNRRVFALINNLLINNGFSAVCRGNCCVIRGCVNRT
ncbi:MAG: hypothetical protein ACOX08_02130 [Methanobacterium sp.]